MYKGSCLCGGISYEITTELPDYGCCHCSSCRKGSGSAYGANIGLERSNFQMSDPDNLLKEFESSPGKFRAFCSHCGSPLFAYLCKSPDTVRVRLGSLDTPFAEHPKAHTFTSDKALWERIDEHTPQFENWASRDILVQAGSKQP